MEDESQLMKSVDSPMWTVDSDGRLGQPSKIYIARSVVFMTI